MKHLGQYLTYGKNINDTITITSSSSSSSSIFLFIYSHPFCVYHVSVSSNKSNVCILIRNPNINF